MDIVGKKYWYFLISAFIIVPGTISLFLFRLNLSIDFIGGTRTEFRVGGYGLATEEVRQIYTSVGVEPSSLQASNEHYIVRTKQQSAEQHKKVQEVLKEKLQDVEEVSFETVGATVSGETLRNALKALLIASVLIVLYIAWSFRKVPKPASSLRFGICAILALLHDVLLVVGVFSILGKTLHVEVDSLFVTALLTITGFSVHDTIVVFDRIRENLKKMVGASFAKVVNESIRQTLVRSLNTSLTVVLVLVSLLLFGGESIRWFIVALLIGVISGTYSSIFNAAPLLVVWHEWSEKKKRFTD